MRNIVENHVEEMLEFLRYDKSQWENIWEKLKSKFSILREIEKSLGTPNFDKLERRNFDKFLYDYRELVGKDSIAKRIRQHSEELDLKREDFITFLGVFPKSVDWIVVEENEKKVIFENLYSLWEKGELNKVSEAVFQSIVHFRKGEVMGNFYNKEKIFEEINEFLAKKERDKSFMKCICKILYEKVPYYDWVGFYMINDEGVLELGDFVGEPTEHVKIKIGEGICGQAADLKKTFIVQNVLKETNYLSCSPKVKSEIVVPIFKDKEVIGEIDIDSHYVSPFDERDKKFLEGICSMVSDYLDK
ncbi:MULTISPECIES: GAF domain-containing protein [unclassified Thermosipho (in: thermotogales)]|uniref:GAF domain-containing protein n=1 Tax=unclassified Thermosipho (in: thermotogales) TaxID=2676525 RepID=UPI00098772F4|nr:MULTISPECIES: GAF domain-containing protein [unclassified Thermosipho (in: thermotogales)]MBT1247467.1 diguanylate cyclase [Thermosipho sp. 1244]OOC46284.1 diguanylate cyclase [Thermosipho sp. 1223]